MNENIWVFRLDKKETVSDRINEVNVVRRRKQQYGLNTSLNPSDSNGGFNGTCETENKYILTKT